MNKSRTMDEQVMNKWWTCYELIKTANSIASHEQAPRLQWRYPSSKQILRLKKIMVRKKILGLKTFRSKEIVGSKNFGAQIDFEPNFFWNLGAKNVGSEKKIRSERKFGCEKEFGLKKILGLKIMGVAWLV